MVMRFLWVAYLSVMKRYLRPQSFICTSFLCPVMRLFPEESLGRCSFLQDSRKQEWLQKRDNDSIQTDSVESGRQ
ncbi:hypothetical protein AFE_1056 [Acidithiobacillus ferrooxidans ATCC 23270]|uniref:Uncharacterized protein n=1 Tax=Acidithiobacillus ferrooxidans (strain ATCC 23270 / DSM 14882 / CIP 104768 / NCIMB 8455) TaxID=243159 RepID=B7J804_ACIF2|nr:hypothetical protein AFE_1056 [Acidithiobacillus ferrooxidans ATCC 23270]